MHKLEPKQQTAIVNKLIKTNKQKHISKKYKILYETMSMKIQVFYHEMVGTSDVTNLNFHICQYLLWLYVRQHSGFYHRDGLCHKVIQETH